MTIARHADWRARLNAAIEERRLTKSCNCGWFIGDCVLAMTGVDIAAPYRGRCESAAQCLALLAADGFPDVCAFLVSLFEEIHPSRARAGDIMAFPVEAVGGWALGVVNGERVTVLEGRGLGTVLRDGGRRAFRVA